MKNYLKNRRREKEKELNAINDIQNTIRKLDNQCISINGCVKEVRYAVQSGLKGDNTGRLAALVDNINKDNYKKIQESIGLASRAKNKIQAEIDRIDRQLREIKKREDEEIARRNENLRRY